MDRVEAVTAGRHMPSAEHGFMRMFNLTAAAPIMVMKDGSVKVGLARFDHEAADLLALLAGRMGCAVAMAELGSVMSGGSTPEAVSQAVEHLRQQLVGTGYEIQRVRRGWWRMRRA